MQPVLIVDGRKRCGKCRECKPVEAFRPNKKTKCGLCSYCRDCENASYRNNPARQRRVKENRERRMANPQYRETMRQRERNRRKQKSYREKDRANRQHRRKHDPHFRIRGLLYSRLGVVLKGYTKADRTLRLLGCTTAHLKTHLESLWLPGMTWENHGAYRLGHTMTWHVDHIIPCAAFDLTKPEEQRKCFHWTNLQPLWASDNMAKRAFVLDYQI